MNKILNFLLFMLLLLFPFIGKAQQLTLKDCFELGKKNQSDFKIQLLKIELKNKTKRSVGSHFLPEVGISTSHNYNFGSSINPVNNNREPSNIQSDNFSIDFRANIFDLSLWKENDIQNLDIEIEKWNLSIIEIQFQLLILDKYMKAIALQEWEKSMKLQVENGLETLNRITSEVEEGKRAKSDAYDIQVIYLQDKNDFEKITQDKVLANLELLQVLNSSNYISNEITLTFPEQLVILNDYLVSENPNLQKSNIAIQKNVQEQKQLKYSYLPTLGFNYSYGTFFAQEINNFSDTNFHFQNQLKDNKSQYFGLSLYIPVFNKGKIAQKQNIKKIEYEILKEENEKETKRLNDLLETAKIKTKFLSESQNRLIEIQAISNKALETTTSKYLFDKVDATIYKLAKNQFLQAEYNVLSNRVQLLFEMYQLQLNFLNN